MTVKEAMVTAMREVGWSEDQIQFCVKNADAKSVPLASESKIQPGKEEAFIAHLKKQWAFFKTPKGQTVLAAMSQAAARRTKEHVESN